MNRTCGNSSGILWHLEQLTKNLEQYYNVAVMPTNKQDWMIDPFAVSNFLEPPLRVAEELMDMTAEASNRLSFKSFKKKHPTLSANSCFWVSICTSLSDLIKVCRKTTDFFCNNISLRSRLQCKECIKNLEKKSIGC